MGNTSRAVAEHVAGHHTPVAGEWLVSRAVSMYEKNSLHRVTKMALLPLLDGPSRHGLVRHYEGMVLHDSASNFLAGVCNQVAGVKNTFG